MAVLSSCAIHDPAKASRITASPRNWAAAGWVWFTKPKTHDFAALWHSSFCLMRVARDPQALSRFQREAQAASALSHPNICTIYNIGGEGGRAFIALEYLDGVTSKYRSTAAPRTWRLCSRSPRIQGKLAVEMVGQLFGLSGIARACQLQSRVHPIHPVSADVFRWAVMPLAFPQPRAVMSQRD